MFVAHAVVACSLITDYSLDGGSSNNGQEGGADATSPTDGPSFPDDSTVALDADPGPVCTEKPCVVQIVASGQNTCARIDDGSVYCWGWNKAGIVGSATMNGDFGVPQKVAFDGPVDDLTIGGWQQDDTVACARRGGIVECWGEDGNERLLGRGGATTNGPFNPVPAPVTMLSNATGGLGISSQLSCALVGTSLTCWGQDYTQTVQTTPVAMTTPKPVTQITGGRAHTCVLLDSEEVACAGNLYWYGPLWNDASYGRGPGTSTFELVSGVTGIAQVASGGPHVCALKKSGVVLCWGRNSRGELGRGTFSDKSDVPAPVDLPLPAKAIGSGGMHSCAILTDDNIWCWGSNSLGRGGTGTKAYSPRGQTGAALDGAVTDTTPSARKIEGMPPGVKRMVVGGYAHTCTLLQNGAVYCWGSATHGQLGNGKTAGDGGVDNAAHPVPVRVVF